MLIISQLLPIASLKAGDLIQLLGISGAPIGLGLLDILCGVNLKGDYFAQQYSLAS